MCDVKIGITLRPVEEYLLEKSEIMGIASFMIIFNNISDLPFQTSIIAVLNIQGNQPISAWLKSNVTGQYKYDHKNNKVYFADDADAIMFYFACGEFG